MRTVVCDASVVLKWYLPDEGLGAQAIGILERYLADEVDIIAPALLEYEIINALIMAARRGRIEDAAIHEALEGFSGLGISLLPVTDLYREICESCRKYGHTAYDASYLALAVARGADLITADQRFYNSVKISMPCVHWLGNAD